MLKYFRFFYRRCLAVEQVDPIDNADNLALKTHIKLTRLEEMLWFNHSLIHKQCSRGKELNSAMTFCVMT